MAGVTHEEEEEFCIKLQHDDNDDDAPTGRCNTAVADDAAPPCRRMILIGTFHIL